MKQDNSKDHQPSLVGVYLGGGCLKDGKHKAHQFFGRLPVSARVIYALDQTPQIDRVVAIVPDITFTSSWIDHLDKPIEFVESSREFIENIKIILGKVEETEDVLMTFCDLPFANPFSFSMLAQSKSEGAVVLPVVQKEQMAGINHLHNIHFYPGKDGYFQFGNAAVISHKVRNLIDLERFNIYYAGKSFRNNPKAKLKAAAYLAGNEGLRIALRYWLSANLQHQNLLILDKIILSPRMGDYQRMINRIMGLPCKFAYGNFASLALDFDYAEDAELIRRNWKEMAGFMEKHSTNLIN